MEIQLLDPKAIAPTEEAIVLAMLPGGNSWKKVQDGKPCDIDSRRMSCGVFKRSGKSNR